MFSEEIESKPAGDKCEVGWPNANRELTLAEFNRRYAGRLRHSTIARARRRAESILDRVFDCAGILLILTTAAASAAALLTLAGR